MEHAEAIATNASERYLLGEVTAAEGDAFEEHFFDCGFCADDVRLGASFLDGGRRLAREEAQTPLAPVVPIAARPRTWSWLPLAAAAAILFIPLNVALMTRNRTTGPAAVLATQYQQVLTSQTRGAAGTVVTLPNGRDTVVWIEVPGEPAYQRYELRVLRTDGSVVLIQPVTSEEALEALGLVLREPGSYDVVIAGIADDGRSAEVSRHRLTARR
jgi:hypothetical protein